MATLTTKLMKVGYFDPKAEVRLECYSDTVVIEQEGKTSYIAAIRLGGYPEQVKGMSDAIFGGGSVTVAIDGEICTLASRVKQYRREYSHDGHYAEAILRIRDEEQRQFDDDAEDGDGGDGNTGPTVSPPRKRYIFCALDDEGQLFEEVDKKTSVPLIQEFQDYVLTELQHRGILKSLQVISAHEKFDAWVLQMSSEEKNIIEVVNDGLRCGNISIPGATSKDFPEVYSVTQYLNTFGVQIAERIKGQFNPLFDPATEELSPEVLAVNDFIIENAGYSLYDAQLAGAESLKRGLEREKATLLIAECGTGKTKIVSSALYAYQQRLNHQVNPNNSHARDFAEHTKHFNIVLSPSHVANKWVREIEETLPNTFAVIANSIAEIKAVYEVYARGDMSCCVVITKERARDGYMRRPAALWSKSRKCFICPDCFVTLKMDISDCGTKYRVPANALYFRKETTKNRKCDGCGTVLWTMLVPEQQSDWVKISDYGFVHRRFADSYLQYVEKKPKVYDDILSIAENPDGQFPSVGAYNRFPLSTYIKRQMKGKIDGLIIDELHNYNNNSGQGDAMGELFQAAKKVVGMTATLINGYSAGIFHLLFRVSSALMLRDNKSYDKPMDFNDEYGVSETVYEIDAPDYNANRRTAKRKIRERQLPGVSPLVYTRFLLENAAFLSLNDMGKDLPEYEEIPIELHMNNEVAEEYERIESIFIQILRYRKEIAQKILSVYLNLLTVYPDQPYGHEPVNHPIHGEDVDPLIIPLDASGIDELHEKDERVLEIVKRKVENGENVLIYTSWTRIDTQTKLTNLLAEQGYRVAVLTAKVPPSKREEWVERQIRNGIQVLITNPSLVETGLDLNDFTAIIFYNISYKLFTLRQAARRSYRINQRSPRIEVYFFFYEGTMQQRAIRLMASKLAVAGVIEGNLTDEGLAAMSDCQDMTAALARELTHGIQGEVEDLSAVFKRMALLKPVVDAEDEVESEGVAIGKIDVDGADGVKDTTTIDIMPKHTTPITTASTTASARSNAKSESTKIPQSSGLLQLLHAPKPKKATKKKSVAHNENQLSLFEMLEVSA